MSLAVGALSSCSKDMGFDENKDKNGVLAMKEVEEKRGEGQCELEEEEEEEEEEKLNLPRQMSEASLYATEEEEEDEEGKSVKGIDLGPQLSLKDQIEKDKDDESLRRWKEQLLGSVDLNSVGENLEPEVNIMSLSIQSPGRPDIVLPIPIVPNAKGLWFTLKEGCQYKLKFTFSVSNNIVSGLKYSNTVWKTGVKVDSTKEMLGTFSPQDEPYICEVPEDTTPSGIFARGSYSARTKFVDDDGKCYLELNYTFDIRKEERKNLSLVGCNLCGHLLHLCPFINSPLHTPISIAIVLHLLGHYRGAQESESMALTTIFVAILLALSARLTISKTVDSLTPAPAPAPQFVNLTELLSNAGPFHTFLNYLTQTQVLQTFQNQANNTVQGVTIFVPKDSAFSSLKKPDLSKITQDQLKTLLLYHALPKYYSFTDFKNLSNDNPVSTFAGGQNTLNVTDASGLIRVNCGWSNQKISSSVYSSYPAAVYQVDHVLIPEAVFGIAPPLPPAPAPAPDLTPPSDLSPSAKELAPKSSESANTESPSFSNVISAGVLSYFATAFSAVLMILL
ncbi:hypothetical protein J5N97_005363 [Dioscorea zingiberensis]|uniref:FAS1 domain-containing protein n=1 Tax=Dioscorea zingiberensis TaxID=325984 RepID=A0A9D5D9Q0_9LILI|nr:hypothetical protein J5N97_005363 [Dioscorea zingiberensis]